MSIANFVFENFISHKEMQLSLRSIIRSICAPFSPWAVGLTYQLLSTEPTPLKPNAFFICPTFSKAFPAQADQGRPCCLAIQYPDCWLLNTLPGAFLIHVW
ncbi:MAG: hypothetical protein QNJ97_13570 [Myxococcota bacterium]|nr:hypothetical protein [Myxococcota bacterium]